jgi:XTP/dITP diphosphohydrolase
MFQPVVLTGRPYQISQGTHAAFAASSLWCGSWLAVAFLSVIAIIAVMTTLLIASRNAHKVGEIRAILGEGFRCLTLNDFPGAPEVVEDAPTFAGNAAKKAVELAAWLARQNKEGKKQKATPDFVLADDSGLEVDALNGAPGVYSARFAALDGAVEGNSPDAANNAKLLRLLKNVPAERRSARFHCVIALVESTPHSALRTPQLFDGVCGGRVGFAPGGQGGFGYDPLFIPDGFNESFAELPAATKNQLSHRARALAKLREHLGLFRSRRTGMLLACKAIVRF